MGNFPNEIMIQLKNDSFTYLKVNSAIDFILKNDVTYMYFEEGNTGRQ